MSKTGPIILIDDDQDDLDIAEMVISQLGINNRLIKFTSAQKAFEYLLAEEDQPFIILSDINLPRMSGIELKRAIENNDELRRKSIPFVYYSTAGQPSLVSKAFELQVQGFFVKESSIEKMAACFKLIFDYWLTSRHPNN
ncbi:MAG TPA: response regulator [Ohtaekwangia sp.]